MKMKRRAEYNVRKRKKNKDSVRLLIPKVHLRAALLEKKEMIYSTKSLEEHEDSDEEVMKKRLIENSAKEKAIFIESRLNLISL
jgi:hypothetical protein